MTTVHTDKYQIAADWIRSSSRTVAFTGAGVSVESGIPPFRGENGLWNKYDPVFLDIDYFHQQPRGSWMKIKEIFYDFFGSAECNAAHIALAALENAGFVHSVITQNIDNLHQEAGSKTVYEFHGNSRNLVCTGCSAQYPANEIDFSDLPPVCEKCDKVLKPDFIFFGEPIPEPARTKSMQEARDAEVFIVVGTTGEIAPASNIPFEAKKNNCKIIEINTEPSKFTNAITDVFLQGKATDVITKLTSMMI